MPSSRHSINNPSGFGAALRSEVYKNGNTLKTLARAMMDVGTPITAGQLGFWCREKELPWKATSHAALHSIEARYALPHGYFMQKLFSGNKRISCFAMKDVPSHRLKRFAWHLPDNFLELPVRAQDEIKAWVNKNIFYNETDFRKYHLRASQGSFSLRLVPRQHVRNSYHSKRVSSVSPSPNENAVDAPAHLMREIDALVSFKTATLPPGDLDRNGRWSASTGHQIRIYLGLFFGAMVASPDSHAAGLGVSLEEISVALLVFPSVWDWCLLWRERRRGFFTVWKIKMMTFGKHLVERETDWLCQNGWLSSHLYPIPGLVSEKDIAAVQTNWETACDKLRRHAQRRIKALHPVVQVHRDSFEPIEPVLAAKSPLGEPQDHKSDHALCQQGRALQLRGGRCDPILSDASIWNASWLAAKNLRELLLCTKGWPTSEAALGHKRRGEVRWNDVDGQWEVFIPANAFKNAKSPYFGRWKPFIRTIPDLDNLNETISEYLEKHRPVLLGEQADPGTFFVKRSVKKQGRADFDQLAFYAAWPVAIEQFGIYNPYTGRGAIKGLLPHGPHCIRDVLATHVVKMTGSCELAGYAIQDTPPVVARHYGRFLPSEKGELVRKVIQDAWND